MVDSFLKKVTNFVTPKEELMSKFTEKFNHIT